jgi:hypothetical protein
MTKPYYTHLTLVVDRSGSMSSMAREASQGIEQLIQSQFAEPGQFSITLLEFDTEFDTYCRMANTPLPYQLVPRGSTALFDAVGREIVSTGDDLSKLKEEDRPEKVIFVIVTDGMENASHEYSLARLREMIRHQKEVYSWDFQFIGAREAAWQGEELGMKTSRNSGTAKGFETTYKLMDAAMKEERAKRDSEGIVLKEIILDDDADDLP